MDDANAILRERLRVALARNKMLETELAQTTARAEAAERRAATVHGLDRKARELAEANARLAWRFAAWGGRRA